MFCGIPLKEDIKITGIYWETNSPQGLMAVTKVMVHFCHHVRLETLLSLYFNFSLSLHRMSIFLPERPFQITKQIINELNHPVNKSALTSSSTLSSTISTRRRDPESPSTFFLPGRMQKKYQLEKQCRILIKMHVQSLFYIIFLNSY